VTSQLIADTLGIPKTAVQQILKGDLKKQKCPGAFSSNNLTISGSKTSRNIEQPPILARFVSPQILPVPKGDDAAEGCKI
jgi:hypothetical protein